MSRAKTKGDHLPEEVGAAIIATWFKALPAVDPGGTLHAPSEFGDDLAAALSDIINVPVKLQFDDKESSNGINIAVPRIPAGIRTKVALLDYLQEYHDKSQGRHYHDELGTAVLFGCR